MVALFYAIFLCLVDRLIENRNVLWQMKKIVVEYKGQEYEAVTVDLSENGVAFRMETPVIYRSRKSFILLLYLTIIRPVFAEYKVCEKG